MNIVLIKFVISPPQSLPLCILILFLLDGGQLGSLEDKLLVALGTLVVVASSWQKCPS